MCRARHGRRQRQLRHYCCLLLLRWCLRARLLVGWRLLASRRLWHELLLLLCGVQQAHVA